MYIDERKTVEVPELQIHPVQKPLIYSVSFLYFPNTPVSNIHYIPMRTENSRLPKNVLM